MGLSPDVIRGVVQLGFAVVVALLLLRYFMKHVDRLHEEQGALRRSVEKLTDVFAEMLRDFVAAAASNRNSHEEEDEQESPDAQQGASSDGRPAEVVGTCFVDGVLVVDVYQRVPNSLASMALDQKLDFYRQRLDLKDIVVNLGWTDILPSGFLGWLVVCRKRCSSRGGEIVLVGLSDPHRRVLKLCRLEQAFAYAQTVREALDRLHK